MPNKTLTNVSGTQISLFFWPSLSKNLFNFKTYKNDKLRRKGKKNKQKLQ